jgi:peptide/nickel transport system permease protein
MLPGDLATLKLGGEARAEDIAAFRKELGLDRPIARQYVEFLGGIARGDLGDSLITHHSVTGELRQRIPVTVELALWSVSVAVIIGLPLGILSALKQDTLLGDYIPRLVGLIGLATPGFWLATLVITFPAIWWNWTPPLRYQTLFESPGDHLQKMIPAALVLGIQLAAITMRMTRSTMLEVLRSDYIRTARAKGLRGRSVVVRHALRNGLIPVVTIIGNQLGFLLGGTVITEQIFLLPGVGKLTYDSVFQRDYPQLQACVIFLAATFVLVNLLVDLSYGLLDPRTATAQGGRR